MTPAPLRVWLPRDPGGPFEAAVREGLEESVDLLWGEQRPEPPDYQILVSGRPTDADLDASPALRRVVIPWAGLGPAVRERLRARPGLAVHNLHHNAPATAEMAVGLLLAAARRILPADRALRAGDWRVRYGTDEGLRLVGARAVVLGYGEIGRRVAHVLAAFGARVQALRRRPGRTRENGVLVVGPEALDGLLTNAEAVVVCLPGTDAVRGLLDQSRLALLAPGAVVVNVGRGDVIDEDALFECLQTGQVGAAGLDVWWRYPASEGERQTTLPSRHPFHELENVVLSPHRAGHGAGTEEARGRAVGAILNAVARGDLVPHAVDLDRGY